MRRKMKRKIGIILLAAALLSGCSQEVVTVAGTLSEEGEKPEAYIEMQEFELKEPAEQSSMTKISSCVVLIPSRYQESEEIPGMYIHEKSPLDSSNIYYSVSEGEGNGRVSESLTEKEYKSLVEEAFQENGQEVSLTIESFEQIDMDQVPGYKVRSTYEVDGEKVEQLTYLLLGDKTYTITYSQMADDELMADFEISEGEIKLVKEDKM